MTAKTNLLDFTLPALTEWFAAQGEKPFRAKQVFQWIHQRGVADFDAMTDLAKALRVKLNATAEVKAPAILSEHRSADGTVKWLFDVGVGNGIETVFIPEDDRGTLCVSSQVGCALDCKLLDGAPGLQSRPRCRRDRRPAVGGEQAPAGDGSAGADHAHGVAAQGRRRQDRNRGRVALAQAR